MISNNKMRKTLTLIFTVCALALASQPAGAQMSDDAVIAYVKDGAATGKSQTDMAKELAARGVTKEQAERIKAKYEQEQRFLFQRPSAPRRARQSR